MRSLALLLLSLLLWAPPVGAVDGEPAAGRAELWRRGLEGETELIARAEALVEALAAGDLRGLSAQFRVGPLLLQIAALGMPPTLCGESQTRVLLTDYFDSHPADGLRVSQVRLEPNGLRAAVACDLTGPAAAPGRPARRRFVATYVRAEAPGGDDWLLTELRCP